MNKFFKYCFALVPIIYFDPILVAQSVTDESLLSQSDTNQVLVENTTNPKPDGNFQPDNSIYYDLVKLESQLELVLEERGSSDGAWDSELTEIYLNLAHVKQDLGIKSEANVLYNRAVQNIRIIEGLYSIEQVPILLDLMRRNFSESEYVIADELGDSIEALYRRNYSEENQVIELIGSYRDLAVLRFNGVQNPHQCLEIKTDRKSAGYGLIGEFARDEKTVIYYIDQTDVCKKQRKDRAKHYAKAAELQKEIVALTSQEYGSKDMHVMVQLLELAEITYTTAIIMAQISEYDIAREYQLINLQTLARIRKEF